MMSLRKTHLALSVFFGLVAFGCQTVQTKKVEATPSNEPVNTAGMVWIPAGEFLMGSEDGRADESPTHKVQLDGFWMDQTLVTNEAFSKFVDATGYQTVAERTPNPKDFPGADPENLVPGSLVFEEGKGWTYRAGANWKHPLGPQSDIKALMNHPVVQVCWDDAKAFSVWAKKSLPTEAQFEYAAKGGDARNTYAWGTAEPSLEALQANYWQGDFPTKNLNTDTFAGTSPVGSFKPNGYKLFDMSGNVWEWCLDWYRPDAYASASPKNPTGPASSYDPDEPGLPKRVVRGGSFLCAECYCRGYRVASRMKTSVDTGLCHTGFRCVINRQKP